MPEKLRVPAPISEQHILPVVKHLVDYRWVGINALSSPDMDYFSYFVTLRMLDTHTFSKFEVP